MMENQPQSCKEVHLLQNDCRMKDNLQTQTEHGSHVTLRHNYATPKDEIGLLLNCNKDSLTLHSVFRYARKIEAFLGWERVPEDFTLEETGCSDSSAGLLAREEYCSSKESILDEIEKHINVERILKDTVVSVSDSGVSCDKERNNLEETSRCDDYEYSSSKGSVSDEAEKNSINVERIRKDTVLSVGDSGVFYDEEQNNLEETSRHDDEKHSLDPLQTKESKKGSNIVKKDVTGSIRQQKLFRSEVSLIVGHYRSDINPATGVSKSNYCVPKILDAMDKSLVQKNGTAFSGLVLNDEGSLLNEELNAIPASSEGNKRGRESNGRVKSIDVVSGYDCNFAEEKDVVQFTDKSDETMEEDENRTDIAVDNSETDIYDSHLDNNSERKKDLRELSQEKLVTEQIYVNGKGNLETPEECLCMNNGKPMHEEIQAKNVIKNDKILKVYIQYDNDQSKESETNNITDGRQTRRASRRFSIFSGDTICGLGIFRPRWLQPYATVKVYVILYSIIGILHGSYYAYLIGTLSTLEKRFAFKSKISGVIMITDEITPLLLGVIIGYYAGKANRPRMISFGMLLSALCCFASSLPYFIYGPVQHLAFQNVENNKGPVSCESDAVSCSSDDRPPTLPVVLILMLGSFFKGFGNLAYYAIGLAYLDDNSDKKSTPIYLAIAFALRLLGPLVGFLMSSVFLKLYENPLDDPGYGPDDPRWIGAWWIGFFLQGVLLVIFTLPIALFPRRLPGQKSMEKNTAPKSQDSWREIYQGLLSALKRLGKNPVFILMIIYSNAKIFGQFGHSIMLPKYMENQFRLSASEASLYSGATSITCIMVATVVGGFFIWKFRPSVKTLLRGMLVSDLLLCIGFLVLMIPRCLPANMVNFGSNSEGLILNGECNQMCDCSTTSFTPFCGSDGKTYFSPCYAGCTQESALASASQKEFQNCSCVTTATNQTLDVIISEGLCPDTDCWSKALIYLIILLIIVSISNSFTVVYTMILLRSVHPNDKSIALGTFETFICLFGFIPFPIVTGALVDSACLVWEQSCGETGNCWFYDMDKFANLLHGVSAGFCFLAVLCVFTLYFMSSRIRDLYAEDEDEKTNVVDIKLDTVSDSVTKL